MLKYHLLIYAIWINYVLTTVQSDPLVLDTFPVMLNSGKAQLLSSGWLIKATGSANVRFYLTSKISLSSFHAGFTTNDSKCLDIEARHQIHFDQKHRLYYFDESLTLNQKLYLCIFHQTANETAEGIHQGTGMTKVFRVVLDDIPKSTYAFPLVFKIIVIAVCLFLAGFFSGLNLGLMSIDLSDLRILQEAGSYKEKYYASVIMPLRKRGNFLLAAIVLGNSFVNSLQTVVMDTIIQGLLTTVISTLLIVTFGEIVPQAICSKYGLIIAARTSLFIRFVMIVTSPLSWPTGKILDFFLGKDAPAAFTREKIRYLIKEQITDVEPREIEIITAVLALKNKTAEQHMRQLKDVFMVDYDAKFDETLFVAISDSGYSRIPVYRGKRSNIVGIVHIKDLALINTNLGRTVGSICETFNLPFGQCAPTDNLHQLLQIIQQKHFHMLVVQETDEKGNVETVGTITLEDIIEEMVEFEILDEFDRTMEEKKKRFANYRGAFHITNRIIPSQLKFDVMQLLQNLEPFTSNVLSTEVLGKLIEQCYKKEKIVSHKVFYTMGKPCDYFMLILTGTAIMEAGVEKLRLEAGPFSHFGSPALCLQPNDENKPSVYIPDFTLYANEDISYLKITRSEWLAATRVSAFERSESVQENPSQLVNVDGHIPTANSLSYEK